MRLVAALGAICALTQAASAEIGDCTAIADAAAQLACYNNEAPPKHFAPSRATPARRSGVAKPSATATDGTKGIDRPSEEDAAVDAKVRGLCRGC